MGAGANVDVGFLKAHDDEFFFTTNENGGTISRDYLKTATAKAFVGDPTLEAVESGAIYVGGAKVETAGGQAADGAFRVIYEIPGVHPQNHCSIDGAKAVVIFFYTSFETPNGFYLSLRGQSDLVGQGDVLSDRHDSFLRAYLRACKSASDNAALPFHRHRQKGDKRERRSGLGGQFHARREAS